MGAKIFLAGDSLIFHPHYQYDPFTTIRQLREEGPGKQQAFREHEMLVRGRTPKQPVVEEATVAVEVVPVEISVEDVPVEVSATPSATAEQPTTPIIVPTPSATEVPKRKLTLKLKDTAAAPVQRSKPKLVLKTQTGK